MERLQNVFNVGVLQSDLTSYFDMFGSEYFFNYLWMFDILCFGFIITDERLTTDMEILHNKQTISIKHW